MNAPFELKIRSFESQVLYFNGMYGLPNAPYPTLTYVIADEKAKAVKQGKELKTAREAVAKRLLDFRKTMSDEVNEVDEIITKMNRGFSDEGVEYTPEDLLTDLADWLVDMQVYCASEMAKFGLPMADSKKIVMNSNFSKLDSDGKPIINDEGKVLKGPGYWKPEPQLKAMIEERIAENTPAPSENAIVWRHPE
jgi:predicted HAD superfamily Cof-like phosphohydrolase